MKRTPGLEELPIVVISLARMAKRRARLQQQLAAFGLDAGVRWFEAVDGTTVADSEARRLLTPEAFGEWSASAARANRGSMTPGALGCALSWRRVLSGITRPTLVLEDDAVLCRNFPRRFGLAMASLPPDWDLVYVGFNPYFRPVGTALDRFVTRVEAPLHGTCALLVDQRAAGDIRGLFPLARQIDHDIIDRLVVPGRLNAYQLSIDGYALVQGDNLGGTTVQLAEPA